MNWFRNNYQHLLALVCVVAVGVAVMWPLTHPGLFTAHDIWHQVARFYHYHAALSEGFWPPGWIINLANDYGYPLFYFSYHLPWMFGEVLLRMGFAIPEALKILLAGAVVASGLTMYWFCWSLTKKVLPALGGAIIYIIAPYHFLTVYVAAAVGSVFQFVFVPLMFLGTYEIIVKKWKFGGIVILAIGLAGSMLSHLMSTVMIVPFVLLWAFLCLLFFAQQNGKAWGIALGSLFLACLLALMLAAFYVLPLSAYKSAVVSDSVGGFRKLYATNFVSVKQLVYSPWGFSPIVSNAKDGDMSLQLGIAQWLGIAGLAAILMIVAGNKFLARKNKKLRNVYVQLMLESWVDLKIDSRVSVIVLIIFSLVCFAMLNYSEHLWFLANTFMTLDYPWRLLMLVVFFGSAAIALLLSYSRQKYVSISLLIVIVLIAWYTNRNHIGVNLYTEIPVADYVDAETTTNTFAEYLPIGTNDKFILVKRPFILEPDAVGTVSAISAVRLVATVEVLKDSVFTLHQYAFPTLSVSVDDKQTAYVKSQEMLIQLSLTKGTHKIIISVKKSPIIMLGYLITLASIVGLLGYILVRIIKSYVKK